MTPAAVLTGWPPFVFAHLPILVLRNFSEIPQDAQYHFSKSLFCLNQPELVSDTMANFLCLHRAQVIILNFMI